MDYNGRMKSKRTTVLEIKLTIQTWLKKIIPAFQGLVFCPKLKVKISFQGN